jgi:hypothetical protein
METLKDYFEKGDYLILDITDIYHIYIDNVGMGLCIELCDNKGNSVNIGTCVDIHFHTFVDDIKDIVLDYLVGNYLYNHF